MTKVQLRNAWFQIHKWIGIALAILFIPLSFTGSLLVWDEPLDHLLRPALYRDHGPPLLPAASRIVSLSIGTGPVVVTAMPPRPSRMRGPPPRLAVWMDPASGRVIDSGPSTSPLLRFVHIFHGNLQIPGVGRAVVGWLGVAMLLSCLTGIWLWWPLTGSVTRGFRWKRQPALDANLHYQVGFWIAVPLAMVSLTGVIIAWPQMVGRTANGMTRPMTTPLAATHLTPDQALAEASAPRRFTITWPTDKDGSWGVVTGRAAMVKIDDASGDVRLAGTPQRARPFYRRLHDGTDMGIAFQILIFVGGVAPALLGVTGIIMWLRSRGWRADVARRRAEVAR
jgi:uncharacterized iron-regulated membrane protein